MKCPTCNRAMRVKKAAKGKGAIHFGGNSDPLAKESQFKPLQWVTDFINKHKAQSLKGAA